ncbi:hypothetical protein ACROYT_G009927 [Oculina patagonica]
MNVCCCCLVPEFVSSSTMLTSALQLMSQLRLKCFVKTSGKLCHNQDIPRTMSFFFIGLFLVAFQVTCHGASERLFPVPPLPVDISQEETHVEKRALDEDACLQAHNYHRALHQNTSYLIWDATLAQDAQDWADRLAQRGLELAEGTGQGENLHWSWSTSAASCDLAVQSWCQLNLREAI